MEEAIGCLSITDIESAAKSKRLVTWHPSCSCKSVQGPLLILRTTFISKSWKVEFASKDEPARVCTKLIRKDGTGLNTGTPQFIWEVSDTCESRWCCCSNPRPMLLLVQYICDNCGKYMR